MYIVDEFLKFNQKNNLVQENDKLVVGFSGGPDSVFLAEMLLELKKHIDFEFCLAHVNHQFRGSAADKDEDFSKDYAAKHKLEFFSCSLNISKLAKEQGLSFEEMGRRARYDFFQSVSEKFGANKIATAHNKDDQIETFLFRMIRGTSLDGLEGIKNTESLVRPISFIYKADILKYLEQFDIGYRVDETNFENDYTRNSIRLDLIPFIEKRYNPKFKDKIYDLIENIIENNDYISKKIENCISDNKIEIEKIKNLDEFLQKKIISSYLSFNKIESNKNKIENILKLISSQGSKFFSLDKEKILYKDYKFMYVLENKKKLEKNSKEICINLPFRVKFDRYEIIADYNISQEDNSKFFFVTNLKAGDEITIRYKKAGDKIMPLGMKNYKKVKDIMINEKVPSIIRDKIPLFLYKDEVFWILGIKKGEKVKAKEQGINILVREEILDE